MTISGPWRYDDDQEWMSHVRSGLGPVIITCAINGGEQGKESNVCIPETPAEIAEQAFEAYEAGATVVHIHPRDPHNHAITARDTETFAEVNRLVRAACPDLIINNTTGASLDEDGTEHFHILDALPEMASFNMGPDMSMLRYAARPDHLEHPREAFKHDALIPWSYGRLEKLARMMQERSIKPELETYHAGQFWVTRYLIERGLLAAPYVHQFVMGYQTSAYPTPRNVMDLVRQLPERSLFFVAGIGPYQLPLTTLGIILGGHVRVGLEDNIYFSRGRKLSGNGELVARIARIAGELERPIATPAEARQILGLASEARSYPAVPAESLA